MTSCLINNIAANDQSLQLMTRNTDVRLGCHDGLRDLQNHPWFAGLDWLGLESKEIHPPFVPDVSDIL